MVDNVNPTSQFHPYQPQDAKPQSETFRRAGLGGLLDRFGIDSTTIGAMTRRVDVRGGLNKARDLARGNPAMLLGGLAALAIGAGLMRKRSLR
jgi:hypothetical protein